MAFYAPVYRSFAPHTPAHTPQGSVGSFRSRTPGQLSLHDYRKQQSCISLISETSQRSIRRKPAVLGLHHGNPGIPTAPPTPEPEEYETDDEDYKGEFVRHDFTSRDDDGWLDESKEGTTRCFDGGHMVPTSWELRSTNIRAQPGKLLRTERSMENFTTNPKRQVMLDDSPPQSPTSPLLPHTINLPELSPNFTPSPSFSFPHHSMSVSPVQSDSLEDLQAPIVPKQRFFKPIKHLPRPAEAIEKPPRTISAISKAPSQPPFHPPPPPALFSAGFSHRNHPSRVSIEPQALNSKESPSGSALPALSTCPTVQETPASVSDILHLYEGDFQLLNRHDSFSSHRITSSLSDRASLEVLSLPLFDPITASTMSHAGPSTPYDPRPLLQRGSNPDWSMYTDEQYNSYHPSTPLPLRTRAAAATSSSTEQSTDYGRTSVLLRDSRASMDRNFRFPREAVVSALADTNSNRGSDPFELEVFVRNAPVELPPPVVHSATADAATAIFGNQPLFNFPGQSFQDIPVTEANSDLRMPRSPESAYIPFVPRQMSAFKMSLSAVEQQTHSQEQQQLTRSEALLIQRRNEFSKLIFFCMCPFPFLMFGYYRGWFNGLARYYVHRRARGMAIRHRNWALNVFLAETIIIFIAVLAWALATRH